MRYGHLMGYGYYGGLIFGVLLIIAIIVLLLVVISSKNDEFSPQTKRLLEMLREMYVRDEINAEEYRQKKLVIEAEKQPDAMTIALIEKYIKREIDIDEYIKNKKELISTSSNNALNILNQRYARGEISEEEYKRIKKEIK